MVEFHSCMPFTAFAKQAYILDLVYLDMPKVLACGMIETDAGLLLVDPGPSTSLLALEAGLEVFGASWGDVHALLLTHIHLDHAGAAGSIVAKAPHIQVYVHRRGAPHMMRPRRLLESAKRIYGVMMESLWGAFLAIPEENVHVVYGGESLTFGRHTLEVAYTPGHATHHVSYWDRYSGTAFVGDTAGMRLPHVPYVMPVSPPPDITVEGWHESLNQIERWAPDQLFVTHFGPHEDIAWHLGDMRKRLDAWSTKVQHSLLADTQDDAALLFHRNELAAMRAVVPAAYQSQYEQFGNPGVCWKGLARYWKKRSKMEDDVA